MPVDCELDCEVGGSALEDGEACVVTFGTVAEGAGAGAGAMGMCPSRFAGSVVFVLNRRCRRLFLSVRAGDDVSCVGGIAEADVVIP